MYSIIQPITLFSKLCSPLYSDSRHACLVPFELAFLYMWSVFLCFFHKMTVYFVLTDHSVFLFFTELPAEEGKLVIDILLFKSIV